MMKLKSILRRKVPRGGAPELSEKMVVSSRMPFQEWQRKAGLFGMRAGWLTLLIPTKKSQKIYPFYEKKLRSKDFSLSLLLLVVTAAGVFIWWMNSVLHIGGVLNPSERASMATQQVKGGIDYGSRNAIDSLNSAEGDHESRTIELSNGKDTLVNPGVNSGVDSVRNNITQGNNDPWVYIFGLRLRVVDCGLIVVNILIWSFVVYIGKDYFRVKRSREDPKKGGPFRGVPFFGGFPGNDKKKEGS